jgi:hypothetical protein
MIINIVLVVHAFSIALRFMLGLLTIEPIFTLSLRYLIDFGTGDTRKKFFSKGVGNRLAYSILSPNGARGG